MLSKQAINFCDFFTKINLILCNKLSFYFAVLRPFLVNCAFIQSPLYIIVHLKIKTSSYQDDTGSSNILCYQLKKYSRFSNLSFP